MRSLLAVCLLLTVSGCGGGGDRPAVTPVSGTVKFKGVPQSGAIVTFSTANSPRTAVGICNANGEFKLTTFDTDDGAIPGSHLVTIVNKPSAEAVPLSPEQYLKAVESGKGKIPRMDIDDKIPAKYGEAGESGLKRDVIAGETNVFNFDLSE